MLPRQADCFQDRAAAAQLKQAVAEGGTVVLGQVLAGMGGVGKTQLAAHHARQAWDKGEVDLLVWVTAATRTAVVSAYAQAATDLLHADPADPERAASAFLAWLQPKPAGDQRPRAPEAIVSVFAPAGLPPVHVEEQHWVVHCNQGEPLKRT
ncbi:hypothetical protein FRZ03_04325 [Streptomyces misionensis]|uniref:NB-ARC domain-containing protein n=1 Tax=Streptomyces misionensis TaxID=67331 RepID=A0A5C6K1N3_9ACTN|nr:hypothetical protein FRZ03_04325 [Streptomyces misionensis]